MNTLSTDDTKQSIVVEYDLAQAPKKVWRALTDAELLANWLMPNDFRAEVGHKFTFRAPPMQGWDGIVQCEVREVDLEKRLVYTWRGGPEENRLDTVVTWTLTPTPSGGTRLRLDHAGFLPKNAFAFDAMSKGWRGHIAQRIDKLVAALD